MAKKFKDYYDTSCARLLAQKIKAQDATFDDDGFVTFIRSNLRGKEFLQRQDLFVEGFENFMGEKHARNIQLFQKFLGPELQTSTGMFTHGWWLWPVGRYIEKNGTACPKTSITFIYELTKRFTGEFAIRPLLEKSPDKTLQTLIKWSQDPNVHVRRLSSEGMRVRLPWAKKLNVAITHFDDFKCVLGNLKDDPDMFVKKSVGNNLNDLMKEDPQKANAIIEDWSNGNVSKHTLWIIKHGQRSLRKKKTKTRQKS